MPQTIRFLSICIAVAAALTFSACSKKDSHSEQNAVDRTPQHLPAAEMPPQQLTQLQQMPRIRRDFILLAQNNSTAQTLETLKAQGASIRDYDLNSGVILANMESEKILDLYRLNQGLGTQSFASNMALSQKTMANFSKEPINPFTQKRFVTKDISINAIPNNHQLPIEEMGASDFEKLVADKYGVIANGDSVKIAIIDTGIDISRKDVFQDRIIYAADMTEEGQLKFNFAPYDDATQSITYVPVETKDGQRVARTSEQMVFKIADNIRAKDNKYYVAQLKEIRFFGGEISDIDQDGSIGSKIYVLLIQTDQGIKVFFDANQNKDFGDDIAIGDYKKTRQTVSLDKNGTQRVWVNINLPFDEKGDLKISDENEIMASFAGYDNDRHGTHVAGIAAGDFTAPQFKNTFHGGAPKAQIISLKSLGTGGGGNENDVIEGMLTAVREGADIINLSMGMTIYPSNGTDIVSQTLDRIARTSNVIFVIASGNDGPGLNQVGIPGTALRAFTVGATVTGETLDKDYNFAYPYKNATLMWYFSSNGPLDDGRIKPDIVAPGTALSSTPNARNFKKPEINASYDVMQGTSMATPAAAGAIALLVDAVKKINDSKQLNLPLDSQNIQRAFMDGAKDLNELNKDIPQVPRYSTIEQGSGLLNLSGAFTSLLNRKKEIAVEYDIQTKNNNRLGYKDISRGVYTSQGLPSVVSFQVKAILDFKQNPQSFNFYKPLQLTSSIAWASLSHSNSGLWVDNITDIDIKIDQTYFKTAPPGVYTARITARDADNQQFEFNLDITYVKPVEPNLSENSFVFREPALQLLPAEGKRFDYFVKENSSALTVDLSAMAHDMNGKADASGLILEVHNPKGQAVYALDEVLKYDKTHAVYTASNPMPGTWEVVVYKSVASISTLPAVLEIATAKVDVPSGPLNLSFSADKPVLAPTVLIRNYGEALNLKTMASITSISILDPDIDVVAEKEMATSTFVIPRGISSVTVSTTTLKGLPNANYMLGLFDEDDTMINFTMSGGGPATVTAPVKPGKKIKAYVMVLDLVTGKVSVDYKWDFKLRSAIDTESSVDSDQSLVILKWGDEATVKNTIDLSSFDLGIAEDLKKQSRLPFLSGSVDIQNNLDSGAITVQRIPINISF